MKTSINIVMIAVLFFSATVNLNAQRKIEKAKEYQENFEYSKAIAIYEDMEQKKNIRKPEVVRDIAHSYLMMNDLESAQRWLSKVNSFSVYSPVEVLQYAYTLKTAGDYPNAISQFRRYADLFPERAAKVPEWIEACYAAEQWIASPKLYHVENLQDVNTPFSEFGVTAFPEGLLFTTDRREESKSYNMSEIFGWTGNPYLKFYHLPDPGKYDAHAEMGEVNTTFHNGPGVFDTYNDVLYFTRTNMYKVKSPAVNSNPTEFDLGEETFSWINRLEIYSMRYRNGKWEEMQPFAYNNVEKFSVGHPALSPDGNVLYFASDMEGGFGGSDIWYSVKRADGSWGMPQNAGPVVNTDGKEVFPVVDKEGTLYFSSDGQPGMGGLDIFQVRGSHNNWTIPENMKYPINSPKDDFLPYFTEPGVAGYLSSNRDGGKGADDIYAFSKQVMLFVRTYESGKNGVLTPLADVNIDIENMINDQVSTVLSDLNGEASGRANCGGVFAVRGKKEGYIGKDKAITTVCSSGYDSIYVDLILDKIELNRSFVLENIYYDFDKWNIRPDAALELDKLVTILNEHPEIDIELGSHTDSRGSDTYNERLSQRRAESAVDYIISRGIAKSRITAKGYGEFKMRVNCPDGVSCSEDQHQLNRRTEFTITRIRK